GGCGRRVSECAAYDDRREAPGSHHPGFDRPDAGQPDFPHSRADFAGPEFNGHGRGFVEPRDSDADGPYGPAGPADFGAPNGRARFVEPPSAAPPGFATPPGSRPAPP